MEQEAALKTDRRLWILLEWFALSTWDEKGPLTDVGDAHRNWGLVSRRPGRAAVAFDAGPRQAGRTIRRCVPHYRCNAFQLPEQRLAQSFCAHPVQSAEPQPACATRLVRADGLWRFY